MKLSNYIKIYPFKEKPGYNLLFSTKSASIILLHKSVLKSIDDKSLSTPDKETLSSLGFLVHDIKKEKEEMISIIDDAISKGTKFNAVAVMNLDCNLACRYCFEGTMKGNKYMTTDTAELMIIFLDGYLDRGKNINIIFYGGEPLLSTEMIKHVSDKLKTSAEQKGLEYTFRLVTNGTLLTGDRARELVSLGFKGAKITIDGPMGNHDKERPFRSGKGSFDTIIRNAVEVCEIIKIQIGGNYNKDNCREFPRLLDNLINEGLTPDKIQAVKFDPISKIKGKYALPDFSDGCESINEPWLYDAGIFLREEILKRGFHTPKIMPSPCMIDIRDNAVINYDGTFYKCPALVGNKGFETGRLEIGIKDYRESHNLGSWKTEQCLDCSYLPLCFGGCRFMKLQKDGNIDGVDCKKPYLDATLETLIKQEIKYNGAVAGVN